MNAPMFIFALETSGRSAVAALLLGDPQTIDQPPEVLWEETLDSTQRAAQGLLTLVDRGLQKIDLRPSDIALVSVAVGPGSFTGLRLGVTMAKTLAYAVGSQIAAVPTLAAMAHGAACALSAASPVSLPRRIWSVLDAQRGELFAASYLHSGDAVTSESSFLTPRPDDPMAKVVQVVGIDAWLDLLKPGDYATGPPLARLSGRLPKGVVAAKTRDWPPTAHSVGRLGWRIWARNQTVSPMQLVPTYYRLSAAEEKAGM